MALNLSLRNGYARTRSPINKKTLNFNGNTALQTLVEKGLFQGAGYYRPDFGTESLIASISGHIIKFTEVGSVWNVTDISISNDLNSATVQQVWMWQSEKWMIINDGSGKLPIFFDGVSCRRSYGESVVLGITAATFTPPNPRVIGEIVQLTLTAPYAGPFNVPVIFNKEFYQPIANGTTTPIYSAVLTNLNDAGTTYPVGTQVLVNPINLAVSLENINLPSGLDLSLGLTVANLPVNSTSGLAVGMNVNWTPWSPSHVFRITSIGAVGTNPSFPNDPTVSLFLPAGMFGPLASNFNIPVGSVVSLTSTTSPTVSLGDLVNPFTAPAIGSDITADLSLPYSGVSGQLVSIGSSLYTITEAPPPSPSTTLSLINLTDTSTTAVNAPADILSVPELPAGRMGAYGMGRNWFSLIDGISYEAGDIVGDASGTPANNFRDSVLKTTENDFLSGGGTFRLPGAGDIITAMIFPPILDSSLGQGQLQVCTPFSMFSNNSPVDRTAWTSLTSPLQTESLNDKGPLSQWSTILVNSDIFFRSYEGVGSLIQARREFYDWGNKPVSNELQRILSLDNQSLLPFGSAVSFDNRYLATCSPNVGGQGVFHGGLISLNFDLLSSLRTNLPPAWEGAFSGINVLQMLSGRVNGTRRCFSFTYNITTSKIELHEIISESAAALAGLTKDDGTTSIISFFETAVLFNQDIKPLTEFIRLVNGEISFSNIIGQVNVSVKYRPLNYPCWVDWHSFTVCAGNDGDSSKPQYRYRLGLGTPDGSKCEPTTNRPFRESLAFQFRVEIEGFCTFEDLKVEAVEIPDSKYAAVVCDKTEAVLAKCKPLDCSVTPDLRVYSTQGLPPLPLPNPIPIICNFKNQEVFFEKICSSLTPSFSGSIPIWASLDAANNRMIALAGNFCGETQAQADERAKNALNDFVVLNLSNGNLTCGCEDLDYDATSLVTIDRPDVTYVCGNVFIAGNNLTSFNLGNLTKVGAGFFATINPVLTSFNLGSLTDVGGDFAIDQNPSLTSANLPNLTNVTGDFFASSGAGATPLTSINIPKLIFLNGKQYHFEYAALDVASVNAILRQAVISNPTSAFIAIDNGTNAAPTGQGLLDKATLIANGNTVQTN